MDINKQNYLKSLFQWGDQTKNAITTSDVSEKEERELVAQLENWQTDIKNHIHMEKKITDDELRNLQTEGEHILFDIRKETKHKQKKKSIPFGKHQLPPLPYKYDALEPHISEEIMRLHHNEHHQSYVDGLNRAEEALYRKNYDMDDKFIKHWLREQAYHGSGHNLHTIFWSNMTPDSNKRPSGEILSCLEKDIGSFTKFKAFFTDAAASVEGAGWAILLWIPRYGRLAVQTFEKHQLFQIADSIPLLVLDMWEHAYYLQYQTDKKSYIKNWWNVVNWENVNERFMEARKVDWTLY